MKSATKTGISQLKRVPPNDTYVAYQRNKQPLDVEWIPNRYIEPLCLLNGKDKNPVYIYRHIFSVYKIRAFPYENAPYISTPRIYVEVLQPYWPTL